MNNEARHRASKADDAEGRWSTKHTSRSEVESDHIKKLTAARPIAAVSELIWNAVDADADRKSTLCQPPEPVDIRGRCA